MQCLLNSLQLHICWTSQSYTLTNALLEAQAHYTVVYLCNQDEAHLEYVAFILKFTKFHSGFWVDLWDIQVILKWNTLCRPGVDLMLVVKLCKDRTLQSPAVPLPCLEHQN